jgi:hypothetical protein
MQLFMPQWCFQMEAILDRTDEHLRIHPLESDNMPDGTTAPMHTATGKSYYAFMRIFIHIYKCIYMYNIHIYAYIYIYIYIYIYV